MGFIEKLRSASVLAKQQRLQRGEQLGTQQEADRVKQEQIAVAQHELFLQKRKKAEIHRQESGLIPLILGFGKYLIEEGRARTILQGRKALPDLPGLISYQSINGDSYGLSTGSPGYTIAPLYDNWGYPSITYPDIPHASTAQGSVLDIAMWDFRNVAKNQGSGLRSWYIGEQKFLAVETRPDGVITFHAGTKVEVSTKVGRESLDSVLERAFNRPGNHRFKYCYLEGWSESS